MAGAIDYKSEAVKLFQQGNGGRPTHRLLVAMAGQNGVENQSYDAGGPPSRQLVAKWHQQYEAAKAAAEAQARADAAFAANPAPLRSIPGGARADEPAETVEAWSARVVAHAVRDSGEALVGLLPRLARVANGTAEAAPVEIAAARELREHHLMWRAIQQGQPASATHADDEPDWLRQVREAVARNAAAEILDEEMADEHEPATAGGAA